MRVLPTENCIKIGFSVNFEKRQGQYSTNTPRFDVLYTYEEGTADDEWGLHQYFKEFQTDDLNGREWFKWDEKIIEFFEANPTIDQIRKHIEKPKVSEKEKEKRIDRLTPLINLLLDLEIDRHILPSAKEDEDIADKFLWRKRFERLIEEVLPLDESDCLEFLRFELDGAEYNNLLTRYNKFQSDVIEVDSELAKFNSYKTYPEKMEYVCERGEKMDNERFILFLDSIPKSFKNYYTALGPEVCKAHKYRVGELEKEYQRQLNNQGVSLDDRIYDAFRPGTRIAKSEIKSILSKIYKDAGYNATAKAVDIEKWFKVKTVKITDKKQGKRVDAFELISRIKK